MKFEVVKQALKSCSSSNSQFGGYRLETTQRSFRHNRFALQVIAFCLVAKVAHSSTNSEVLIPLNPSPDGYYAKAGLIQASDGDFYGTTEKGGNDNVGTLFRVTSTGLLTTLLRFSKTNGSEPAASLLLGSDGNLYGSTAQGGANLQGTLFRISTNGTFTNLASFALNTLGAWPEAALIQGADGSLYGTTSGGGPSFGSGTVFRCTTGGLVTVLYTFMGGTDGDAPRGGVAQGADGYLYGTTFHGGQSGKGTIFRVTTNGAKTTLFSFNGTNGANPRGDLIKLGDGSFCGTTLIGGLNTSASSYGTGYGTIFRITTNGTMTTLFSFDGTNGANPWDSLLLGRDGKLYGTTVAGGVPSGSTIFQLSTNGALNTLWTITGINGCLAYGGLAQGDDGRFYGVTASCGPNGSGTVFRLGVPMPINQTLTANGGMLALDWTAVAGQTYQVQFKTNLAPSIWSDLGNTITATNSRASLSDTSSISPPMRFYRVGNLP